MPRIVLCCLLVLLTACASAPAPPAPTREAPATPTPTPPPPRAAATATSARTSVAPGARTCPEGLSWASCVATAEASGTAGFIRAASGATPGATPGAQGVVRRSDEETALVTRVIDGRTIEVRLADGQIETVRYLGVATPEAGECYGPEASARNTALVGGRTVRLERDVSERDRNERLLRHVWVIGDGGALRLASEELVRDGYGTAADAPPDVKHRGRIAEAQREASAAGRGLLAACAVSAAPTTTPTEPPPPPTPTIPISTATSAPPPPPPPQRAATATPRPPEPTPVPTATAMRVLPTATPEPPAPAPPAIPTATATRVPPTATRVPTRPPPPTPTPTPKAAACHPSYPTLCLPGAPDLDCADLPQKAFPVRQPDPHRFDADKDGIGCEE